MKRTLLLIAISVIALKSHAQTEAGKFMLGGNVIYNSSKNSDDISTATVSITPQAGYFIKKNLAIGTAIGYQMQRLQVNHGDVSNSYTNKTTSFVVAPFARYYTNITEQFRFFGQLSVPMSFGNSKTGDGEGNHYVKQSTNRSIGAKLSPGFAFFPGGSKVSFEFSVEGLNYNHGSNTYDESLNLNNYNMSNKSTNNQFVIGGNFFSPSIGVYFYL